MSAETAKAMATDTALPAEANPDKVQGRASNPLDSVWVGASAGTGKTKVLTDRVLRLLLQQSITPPFYRALPERILCITFTKAAAAQMAIRINEVLGMWATIDDDDLRAHLEKLTAATVDDNLMTAARRLFAAVVDTPGGMKILTIHAFCQSVLRRFPLEAGLPPHFEVMDDLSARETLRGAQEHTLEAARRKKDSPLGQAMTQLTNTVTDPEQFTALMGQITSERSLLKRLIHTRGEGDPGAAQLIADVYNRVGARMRETMADIVQDACRDKAFMGAQLKRAGEGLSAGAPTDQARSATLLDWLGGDIKHRAAGFEEYCKIFLTAKGEPRKTLATKGAVAALPDIEEILAEEAQRLINVRQKISALSVAKNTEALLRVGADILRHYEARKRAAALLDYDDLIFTTLALLEKSDTIAQWVLFKLDGGLDHLLIDEAQDTNPEQWEIAKRLSDAFWEGLGQHEDVTRTIFVVGDDKQSIYSFQRADPAKFVEMRDYFARRLADMGSALKRVPMQMSFRSTSAVLNMVDACFAGDAAQGVDFSGDAIRHYAWRAGQAGRVELWPPVCPPDPPPLMKWALPVADNAADEGSDDARTQLAKGIAARIAEWLESGEILKSKGRRIRPSDIMILVRSRGAFVEQMVRALKSLDVPVSGIDRMVLTEQLAVMDMLVLADFLLLERDDLSLATILKSPLIGMDDDDLMALALERKGSLWRALLGAQDSKLDDKFSRVADYLKILVDHAAIDRPYEFFARVLSSPCPADAVSGRRAMMGRLGLDAIDPLDELLNKALEFEASHAPSLQGFVAWLRAGSSEIKRELEQGDLNEVRIMTVHGAKGLQAPIVFLPDTMSPPAGHVTNRDTLLWPGREDDVPLWAQRMAEADPVYTERRRDSDARAAQEYRRLFYVALTRAEDRLYIGGWMNKRGGMPEGCWYDLAAQGMARLGDTVVTESFKLAGRDVLDRDGEIQSAQIYDVAQTAEVEKAKEQSSGTVSAAALPDWARRLPGNEPTPPVPLAPSKPATPEQAVFSPLRRDDSDIRWKRGTLVHQLLQLLPDLPADSREKACRAFLARPGHALSQDQQNAMAAETMRVLQDDEFAPIFGPGSMAEVPVSGLVGKGRADKFSLSGQIDRLLVTDDEILIVDYKTNRPPPRDEADVSLAYLKQMAAYRAVISGIWPDRDVRCALLWTDGPFLMPLSARILDTHVP